MPVIVEYYIPKADRKNTVNAFKDFFESKFCPKIEKGLYDYAKQYCKSHGGNMENGHAIYIDCVGNLLFNCKQNNRTIQELQQKISKREFNPYNLAFLRPDELDEDNWMKIIMRKNTTEDRLNNLPTIEWKPCKICKNIEYFYYQMQTRSADEPMTTFYVCKKCKKTFKVNN